MPKIYASIILALRESRRARQELRRAGNATRGGNLLLSGVYNTYCRIEKNQYNFYETIEGENVLGRRKNKYT